MFTGSENSEFINALVAFIHSSIYKKDLVWLPSPKFLFHHLMYDFLQSAAGTFSFPPSKVPKGPKMLSGKSEHHTLMLVISFIRFKESF